MQRALDEFVNDWVGKEVNRLLDQSGMQIITRMQLQRVLEEAGHNLRGLIDSLTDLVQHFAAGSPVSVSFE